ncbi:hypothetical protein TWF718_001540 [Orbilia javanica]|uniref:Uncharacterized protein n=1 Tax=Orbilia javanica TaxID=47235 RepID=A0AAN8N0X5_9PEZI
MDRTPSQSTAKRLRSDSDTLPIDKVLILEHRIPRLRREKSKALNSKPTRPSKRSKFVLQPLLPISTGPIADKKSSPWLGRSLGPSSGPLPNVDMSLDSESQNLRTVRNASEVYPANTSIGVEDLVEGYGRMIISTTDAMSTEHEQGQFSEEDIYFQDYTDKYLKELDFSWFLK